MTISLVGHFLVNQPISGKRVKTGWIEGNRSKGKAKCVDATRFDCIAKRKWGNTKLDFLPMKLCEDHLNTCAGEGAYTHLKICGHVFSSISLYAINSQLTHTWVSSPWKGKLCNVMLSKTFSGSVVPSRIQQGIMCAGLWNFHGDRMETVVPILDSAVLSSLLHQSVAVGCWPRAPWPSFSSSSHETCFVLP